MFRKLLKSEQKHSVRIAREIEYIINHELTDNNDIRINKNILVKSALLHDIGKILSSHLPYYYDDFSQYIEEVHLLLILLKSHSNMEDEMIKFFQEIDDRN